MLRIQTLGGLTVSHAERTLGGAVAQPRRVALLAVLARSGDRGVARERLVSLFWPDEDGDKGRRALAQALYVLRCDLGSERAIAGTHELRLDAAVIGSDVSEFSRALKQGQLAVAASLYGGPFLDGFHLVGAPEFERWVDEERRALAGDYARCLERLASGAERDGDQARAAEYLRQLSSLDPLNAKVAVRLMRTLESLGDYAGALSHARIYETLVAQELELPPDREVVSLAIAIRASAVAPGATVATNISPDELARSVSSPNELARSVPPTDAVRSAQRANAVTASVEEHGPPGPARSRQVLLTGLASMLLLGAGIVSMRELAWSGAPRVTESRRVTVDDGLELDPAISPDGRLVAYAGGVPGSLRLFVRQVEGGRPVAITANGPAGDHRRPRWSPDGTRLLFQSERAIWTVPALGGSTRIVIEAPRDPRLDAAYPTWSPNGQELAWVSDGALRIRALDGGASRVIAQHEELHSLAWSPDGSLIAGVVGNLAFTYGEPSASSPQEPGLGHVAPSALWLFPVRDGQPLQLTDRSHLNTSPDWLGDSRHLVFVSDRGGGRDIFLLTLDRERHPAEEPVRLTAGLDAHSVTASANGLSLAYTSFRQTANIWSVAISDGDVAGVRDAVRLTRGGQNVEAMDVSPDGRWLAFDADRNGQQDIFRISTSGGQQERVVAGSVDDFHPEWSPDGRSIALDRMQNGVRKGAVVNAGGGIPRLIRPAEPALEENSLEWSPDGTRLLFVRYVEERPQLFETVREGDTLWSAPRQLTTHGGTGATYSPDGLRIAYFASPGELRVMTTADGESSGRILLSANSRSIQAISAQWAPAGDVLFVKGADATTRMGLYGVPIDGSPPRLLVRFDDPDRPFVRPEFATDGKRIFFTLAERTADVGSARLTSR